MSFPHLHLPILQWLLQPYYWLHHILPDSLLLPRDGSIFGYYFTYSSCRKWPWISSLSERLNFSLTVIKALGNIPEAPAVGAATIFPIGIYFRSRQGFTMADMIKSPRWYFPYFYSLPSFCITASNFAYRYYFLIPGLKWLNFHNVETFPILSISSS